MAQGRSLELFFVDGDPTGVLVAQVFNWTGHIIKAPRSDLKRAIGRPEAGHTGIYLLLDDEDIGGQAYLGEAENLKKRISQHSSKDWWTRLVLISAANNALHKAHAKYLETRLLQIAQQSGRSKFENANLPELTSLSEADRANMEQFIEYILLVLPAIGVTAFQMNAPVQSSREQKDNSVAFFLELPAGEGKAEARLDDGEFIVKAGSSARASWVGREVHNPGYAKLHARLVENGTIVVKGGKSVFESDYRFSSASGAAAIVLGRSAAGPREWKLIDGTPYKDWEADRLNDASEDFGE